MQITISLNKLRQLLIEQKEKAGDEAARIVKKDHPNYDSAKIYNGIKKSHYPKDFNTLLKMKETFGIDNIKE